MIPPGFDVPAAKRSASGKRGAITRLINQIEPFIQNLQVDTITNAEPANWLVRNLNKLERMRDELHVAYETLTVADAPSRARYVDSQERLEEAVNPVITNIMATLAVLPSSSNMEPPQAQAPQGEQRPRMGTIAKANTALQPTILTPDNTPLELATWKIKFASFWRTSHLNTLSNADQQAYLIQYMDPDLTAMMLARISPDLKIFPAADENHLPDGSCMNVLKGIFLERYPMVQRRGTFFTAKFNSNGDRTKLMAYCNKLEQLAAVAELNTMETSDIVAFKVLSSVDDDELQRLCARERVMNMRILKLNIAAVMRESLSYKPATVSNVFHDPMSETKKTNVMDGEVNAIHCYECGKEGHISRECYKKKNRSKHASSSRSEDQKSVKKVSAVNKHKKKRASQRKSANSVMTAIDEVYVPSDEEEDEEDSGEE